MHEHKEKEEATLFGFWIYLMTDLMMFAVLFATFAVLRDSTFGGPHGYDIFSLPFVLTETLILLTSSFTAGLGNIAARAGRKSATLAWFALTFILGATFLVLEISEFRHLVLEGFGWQRSAFLSSFFALVGTHGLHILSGLVWMGILFAEVSLRGLTSAAKRHLTLLSLFWHFLDIVWIFIFSIVYLLGVI